MTKYGQAAPANPSTDGSRQESWPTARSLDGQVGESLETWEARRQRKAVEGINLHRPLPIAVEQEQRKQWATPNVFAFQPPENTEQWTKRAEYQQTEKGVNLHKPIQTQVLHELEKQWRTPSSSDGEGGVMEMRDGCAGKYKLRDHVAAEEKKSWATPQQRDFKDAEPLAKWTERAEEQKAKGVNLHLPLPSQVMHTEEKSWGTPTARDHKTGRGNNEREYKELTPMVERTQTGKLNPRWVETLQGVCMGWTSPSCPASVIKNWPKFVRGWRALTIEQTNCDSSATESCLPPQSELLELF